MYTLANKTSGYQIWIFSSSHLFEHWGFFSGLCQKMKKLLLSIILFIVRLVWAISFSKCLHPKIKKQTYTTCLSLFRAFCISFSPISHEWLHSVDLVCIAIRANVSQTDWMWLEHRNSIEKKIIASKRKKPSNSVWNSTLKDSNYVVNWFAIVCTFLYRTKGDQTSDEKVFTCFVLTKWKVRIMDGRQKMQNQCEE